MSSSFIPGIQISFCLSAKVKTIYNIYINVIKTCDPRVSCLHEMFVAALWLYWLVWFVTFLFLPFCYTAIKFLLSTMVLLFFIAVLLSGGPSSEPLEVKAESGIRVMWSLILLFNQVDVDSAHFHDLPLPACFLSCLNSSGVSRGIVMITSFRDAFIWC